MPRTPATDTSGEARGCGHIAPQHRPHHVRPLDWTGNDTGFKRGGGATHARPRHQRRREGVRPRRTTTQAASRAATEPDWARHRIDEGRGCHARPAQTHTVGRYDHVAPETQATPRAAVGSGTCRIYLSWGHRDAHQRGMLNTRGSGEGVQPRCTDIDGRTTCGRGKRRQGYGRRGCQSSVHKSTLQAPTGANFCSLLFAAANIDCDTPSTYRRNTRRCTGAAELQGVPCRPWPITWRSRHTPTRPRTVYAEEVKEDDWTMTRPGWSL